MEAQDAFEMSEEIINDPEAGTRFAIASILIHLRNGEFEKIGRL